MYLRNLIAALGLTTLLATGLAKAQITVTKGASLSIDASRDGRLAIDLQGDLWIVPAGGGDARGLTNNLKSVQRPRWSPNDERIVFQAVVDSQQGIWAYELGSGQMHKLGTNGASDLHPAWHPSGNRVLYSSNIGGAGYDIWDIDLATGLRRRLSQRRGDETEAAWSSDGRDLVYVHHDDGQWSLVLRRHARSEEVLLSSTEQLAAPTWRPDNSLITFFRDTDSGPLIEMVILSEPRLIRPFASDEQFVVAPISWLDRHRFYYSANGQIRQRLFNAWHSSPLLFRATITPPSQRMRRRERPTFAWPDEPAGDLVIHAWRLFDGVASGYRHNQDIVIVGGRIDTVEEHQERPGSIIINLDDLTVIPGLIDADAMLPVDVLARHGPELLSNGVTTIVGNHADAERLDALWSGKQMPGPRWLSGEHWQADASHRPELDVTAAVVTSRSTGLPAGEALSAQFRAMRIAGLTPEQSLRSMGVNAAAAMLADPYLGRIAAGAAADLVLVAGDPLINIEGELNVVAVVRNGRFYSVSGLTDRSQDTESVE